MMGQLVIVVPAQIGSAMPSLCMWKQLQHISGLPVPWIRGVIFDIDQEHIIFTVVSAGVSSFPNRLSPVNVVRF